MSFVNDMDPVFIEYLGLYSFNFDNSMLNKPADLRGKRDISPLMSA